MIRAAWTAADCRSEAAIRRMKRRYGTGYTIPTTPETSSSSRTATILMSLTGSWGRIVKASGYGNRTLRKQPGSILDDLAVTFEFADGTVFSYAAGQFDNRIFEDISRPLSERRAPSEPAVRATNFSQSRDSSPRLSSPPARRRTSPKMRWTSSYWARALGT